MWKSITDNPPEEYIRVFIGWDGSNSPEKAVYEGTAYMAIGPEKNITWYDGLLEEDFGFTQDCLPTHWQGLPDAP